MSAQAQAVASVARRGYLDGWTDDELVTRQVAKFFEEIGELASIIETDDPALAYFLAHVVRNGRMARRVFDNREHFVGATVANTQAAQYELADLGVVLAVMGHALHVPDVMFAASQKALADEARGVRNGQHATG